ncbi:MAG: hypothetical protein GTN67_03035 [Hydrotalea flava]|uniref:hypothetical protein n=1 Tax=Hydrotalea TaxID=1004300 RepID=UPI0009451C23|nr:MULTISPECIES: hypothetical protein [Hydrotalea]NIM34446.1 hypothetical protein [Hydrotalea flava]NIM37277.1 hypothetical protein [Hydrotalea flava]NIN02465.1 hypothetical protein [Hydrotalea flava]NIN14122.1 hypothetical protein [Hydrotalea flava]NIO93203.1 hypothetical protein [Hydrotalea flava]
MTQKTTKTNNQLPITEETILHYLEGNLSDRAMHAFEEEMESSAFLREAIEGLETFTDKKALRVSVKQLQKQLRRRTEHTRKKRYQFFQQRQFQNIILIVALLLLIFLGVIVVHFLKLHPLLK